MDEMIEEPSGREELELIAEIEKEDDERIEQQNKKPIKPIFYESRCCTRDYVVHTGCSACVSVIHEGKIYVANASDSRAVLWKNGIAYAMSIDHISKRDSESERIHNAGGWLSDGRVGIHVGFNKGHDIKVSRGLGYFYYKRNNELNQKDQIITAYPDVVWDNLFSDCEFMIIGLKVFGNAKHLSTKGSRMIQLQSYQIK